MRSAPDVGNVLMRACRRYVHIQCLSSLLGFAQQPLSGRRSRDRRAHHKVRRRRCSQNCCPMVQDQLKLEMAAGRTFVHLQEAPITFRPTYKFDKHSQVWL